MKKVIYLLGIMLLMAGAVKAQDSKAAIGPEIEFEKVVHDYGDVPFNGNGGYPLVDLRYRRIYGRRQFRSGLQGTAAPLVCVGVFPARLPDARRTQSVA